MSPSKQLHLPPDTPLLDGISLIVPTLSLLKDMMHISSILPNLPLIVASVIPIDRFESGFPNDAPSCGHLTVSQTWYYEWFGDQVCYNLDIPGHQEEILRLEVNTHCICTVYE